MDLMDLMDLMDRIQRIELAEVKQRTRRIQSTSWPLMVSPQACRTALFGS
ncbi:hypothetical protein J2X68_003559 [Streptomyces sp. 3330]|nr:hypothetical protein [Streptomyces sp. 3330]MDR6976866.1 hypothetical protein [Streptomyces sp. 3330]